jgi:hypothetical protein
VLNVINPIVFIDAAIPELFLWLVFIFVVFDVFVVVVVIVFVVVVVVVVVSVVVVVIVFVVVFVVFVVVVVFVVFVVVVVVVFVTWPNKVWVPRPIDINLSFGNEIPVITAAVIKKVYLKLIAVLLLMHVVKVVQDEVPVSSHISPVAIRHIGFLPLPRYRPDVEVGIVGLHVHKMLGTIVILVDSFTIKVDVKVFVVALHKVVWWLRWSFQPVIGEDRPALWSKEVLVLEMDFFDGCTTLVGTPNEEVLLGVVDHVSLSKLLVVVSAVHHPVPSVLVVVPGTVNVFLV